MKGNERLQGRSICGELGRTIGGKREAARALDLW